MLIVGILYSVGLCVQCIYVQYLYAIRAWMVLMLELRELRNFVVVAARLNITNAAHEVNLSQPALSRQIQALERKLGVDLFHRVGKRLVLTAEGSDFAEQAKELLERASDLTYRASSQGVLGGGTLRIGASPQTTAWLLSPAMAVFRSRNPDVRFVMNEGNNDKLIEMVEHGAAHLVVANLGINHLVAGRRLFDARLLAVLPPDHDLRDRGAITIEDIADTPLLIMRRGFLTRHLFEQAALAHGVRPEIVLESDSTYTLRALARDGHGIAIVSSSARDFSPGENIVPIRSSLCQTSAEVSALWDPKRYQPKSLSSFVNVLAQICEQESRVIP